MATIEVNTWATLAAAIVSATDGDTIKLINDIDCNLEYPQGVSGINISVSGKSITLSGKHAPSFEVNRYYVKTISSEEDVYTVLTAKPNDWDNNYTDYYYKETLDTGEVYLPVEPASHKILNLQNSSSNTLYILYADGLITFEYIDWQNLLLNGADLVCIIGQSTDNGVVSDHCRFTGSRSGNAYLFNVGHDKKIQLLSCAFDMPWMGANVPDTQQDWTALAPKWGRTDEYTCRFTADYCLFKEHYTGWVICVASTSSVDVDAARRQMYSCAPFIMNGCYIYGDMTISGYVTRGYINIINPKSVCSANPQKAMNIFDCDVSSYSTNPPSTNYNKSLNSNFFGVMTKRAKDVNGDLIENYENLGSAWADTSKAFPIYVTVKEFGSDKSLSEKGFDIIYEKVE